MPSNSAGTETILPFNLETVESSIPARFESVVALCADRLAVRGSQQAWRYAELNGRANCLAQAILSRLGQGAEPVALLLDHDASLIAAILAVLKAGKFYCALYPPDPATRKTHILADLGTRLLITDNHHCRHAGEILPPGQDCQVLNLDELEPGRQAGNPGVTIPAEFLCGIFYTSGSTGAPKGVPWTHRTLLQRLWIESQTHPLQTSDRCAFLRPASFAASARKTFEALCSGASLHVADAKEMSSTVLAEWIEEEGITSINIPIELLRNVLDTLEGGQVLASLRTISLGGAVLYKRDVEHIRSHVAPACILFHRYASSETSLIAQMVINSQTVLDGSVVPVGYPAPGKEVLILDENHQPLAAGESGEIAVKSRFLSQGYWNQPSLTEEKYIPDPHDPTQRIYLTGDLGRLRPDGCLEFLGRKDSMVKVRGFRVELGAVESALLDLPGVRSAVVTAHSDAGGEKYLAAYIVSASQPPPQVGELRAALAQTLPDYMLPSAYVFLDALPLTTSGKVDRKALPEPGRDRAAMQIPYAAPRTAEEEILAGIWEQVLGLKQVGVNDNFFELGGHSLAAGRILARLQDVFKVDLPVRSLFENPTISGLAQIIANMGGSAGEWGQAPPLPPIVRQPRKEKSL